MTNHASLSLIPEPEPFTTVNHAPAAADPSWAEKALTLAGQHHQVITITVVSVVTAAALWTVAKMVRRRSGTPAVTEGRLRKTLVYLAASIGSGFTITSMWNAFEHRLHIDNIYVRLVLCAVFEIMMLASAVNSRAFRIKRAAEQAARETAAADAGDTTTPKVERREFDVDGLATWVFASVGAWVCYSDSTNSVEAVMRGFLPLGVAWMWERAIAADLRTFARTVRDKKINLRISTERILVALRIAEPTGRDVSEVDKARYRSTFTVAAFKLHTLRADGARQWRIGVARWRLRRAGLAIMKRSGVAELMAARHDVATLYGIEDFTAPSAVDHLADWRHRVIDVTPSPDATPTVTNASDTGDAPQVTATHTIIDTVTGAVTNAGTPTRADAPPTVTPTPVTPTAPQTGTVTGVTRAVTAVTSGRVRPLSRDVIDAEFASWTSEQVEAYATERAQQVLAETSNKTAGMREYFLVCLALGVDPKGSAMAKAVGASGGLGRGKAIEWHGQLAVDNAELLLRAEYDRVAAEWSAGDGRD